MRLLLLTFFSSFSILAYSQINMDRGITHSLQYNQNHSSVDIKVSNISDEEVTFFWDVSENITTPSEWQFKVCDMNTCYDWGVSQPCEIPAYLEANASYNFKIYLQPNGVSGINTVKLRTLVECDGSSVVLAETPITWEVVNTTKTAEFLNSSDILIYPNPSYDRFQLRNDGNIASVAIFNIIGKNVLTEKHRIGASHDISDLQKGIYLVRLMDKKNEVLKVVRLTRR